MEFLLPYAQYLKYVYLVMTTILTVSMFVSLKKMCGYSAIYTRYDYRPIVLFSVFMIVFYGLRPITYFFGDTGNYATQYRLLRDFGIFGLSGNTEASNDFLFYTLMKLSSKIMDVHLFFLLCIFLYISMMFVGCRKIDLKHGALLMLFCYCSFEFYPFAVNGIRNGVACSLVIMALAYICKGERVLALLFSTFAIGFHKSVALPVAAMFFTYYVSKPKYMYLSWFGAIILSLLIGDYIDDFLSSVGYDERLTTIIKSNEADGVIMEHRFRWDFLLYSSIPLLLGWYAVFKRKLYNKTYLILLGTYIYANAFWILAIRTIFSNRIAYLSWFIYPIVLAYPLLNFPVFKKNHSKNTAWIMLGQLGFTIIMFLLGK